MHLRYTPPAEPIPGRQHAPSTIRQRLVYLALPVFVLAAVLSLLWFGGFRQDRVPSSIRDEAERNCSSTLAPEPTHPPGSPGFDRCVSDWIAILWD